MSVLLIEALRGLDLRPGQTYRAQVDGRTVELRILEEGPTPEVAAGVVPSTLCLGRESAARQDYQAGILVAAVHSRGGGAPSTALYKTGRAQGLLPRIADHTDIGHLERLGTFAQCRL